MVQVIEKGMPYHLLKALLQQKYGDDLGDNDIMAALSDLEAQGLIQTHGIVPENFKGKDFIQIFDINAALIAQPTSGKVTVRNATHDDQIDLRVIHGLENPLLLAQALTVFNFASNLASQGAVTELVVGQQYKRPTRLTPDTNPVSSQLCMIAFQPIVVDGQQLGDDALHFAVSVNGGLTFEARQH